MLAFPFLFLLMWRFEFSFYFRRSIFISFVRFCFSFFILFYYLGGVTCAGLVTPAGSKDGRMWQEGKTLRGDAWDEIEAVCAFSPDRCGTRYK